VARPQERKFLGFSFTAGTEVKRMIAPKALDRFRQRIREITRRAKGVSMETTMEELAPYMRGWRSCFGFCETPEVLVSAGLKCQQRRRFCSHSGRRFQRRHTLLRGTDQSDSGAEVQDRKQPGAQTTGLPSGTVRWVRNIGRRSRLVYRLGCSRSHAVVGPCRSCHAAR